MRKSLKWSTALVSSALAFVLVAPGAAQAQAPAATGNLSHAQEQALYDRIEALLPADAGARAAALRDRLDLRDGNTADVIDAVIDPNDYVCKDTEVAQWIDQQTAGFDDTDLLALTLILLFDPVDYDALLFPEPAAQRHFGVDGRYTDRLQRTFRGLKGFWDIHSSDIELVPVHGRTILDTTRTARVLKVELGLDDATAATLAEGLKELADQDKFDHGDFPLFTFNAFAFSAKGQPIPGVGQVSDKILVGDGVLEGMADLGFDDIAPSAIISHEFGHHIQYEDGLDESTLPGPEASRRLELMADTFGAYYLTHLFGAHVGIQRVKEFARMFYDLGDCQFDSDAHHGTPDQRRKAADFGALNAITSLIFILPSKLIGARFDKVLPKITAPDAPPITSADLA
jgi:hypothetical protein